MYDRGCDGEGSCRILMGEEMGKEESGGKGPLLSLTNLRD